MPVKPLVSSTPLQGDCQGPHDPQFLLGASHPSVLRCVSTASWVPLSGLPPFTCDSIYMCFCCPLPFCPSAMHFCSPVLGSWGAAFPQDKVREGSWVCRKSTATATPLQGVLYTPVCASPFCGLVPRPHLSIFPAFLGQCGGRNPCPTLSAGVAVVPGPSYTGHASFRGSSLWAPLCAPV